MQARYTWGVRRIGTVIVLALAVLGGCSSSKDTPKTTVATTVAATTPSLADQLMSYCITHTSRADVEAQLRAQGKTDAQVSTALSIFDGLMATGDC